MQVEIEPDMRKRLNNAKKLLENGSAAYNEILNQYSLKATSKDAPSVNQ